jgi:hypothetical protein
MIELLRMSRNRQKIERYGSAADAVAPVTQEPGRRTIGRPPYGFAAGQSLPNIYRSGPISSSARLMCGAIVAAHFDWLRRIIRTQVKRTRFQFGCPQDLAP